jgi:hypothetical protein
MSHQQNYFGSKFATGGLPEKNERETNQPAN